MIFSESYIQTNFKSIKSHANVIEARLADEWLTPERMLIENKRYLKMCQDYHLSFILKNDGYCEEEIIKKVLDQ